MIILVPILASLSYQSENEGVEYDLTAIQASQFANGLDHIEDFIEETSINKTRGVGL